jgi:hypothetical protein
MPALTGKRTDGRGSQAVASRASAIGAAGPQQEDQRQRARTRLTQLCLRALRVVP